MRFEWDARKNTVNIAKHGIDFADVPEMFKEPMLVKSDARNDYGEDRWIGMGWLGTVVAVVVFVERKEVIRVISARKAAKNEIQEFKKNIPH